MPGANDYGVDANPYLGSDLEKARALLAEAGLADGFEFDLYVTSTYDFLHTPAETIQANLAAIGVTANIVAEGLSINLPKALAGDFQAMILGDLGQSDPDDFLYNVFLTGNSGNRGGFSDATVDALLTQGREVADQEARRAIYLERRRSASSNSRRTSSCSTRRSSRRCARTSKLQALPQHELPRLPLQLARRLN